MKVVSELYNKHQGEDIYVVGTGTSSRVFPKDFLKGKITIGLNMAWKSFDVNYSITIHPDLNVPEFQEERIERPEITWVSAYKKSKLLLSPEHFAEAEKNHYFFYYHGQPNTQPPDQPSNAGRLIKWVETPCPDNNLYIYSSISQAAVNLAANMGAKNIILVGCDNASIGGNHHGHLQHTRWKGIDPNDRYYQYYEGLAEIRPALRKRGVNLLSLSPFLKLDLIENQFNTLCDELSVEKKIIGKDISPNIPKKPNEFLKKVKKKIKKLI